MSNKCNCINLHDRYNLIGEFIIKNRHIIGIILILVYIIVTGITIMGYRKNGKHDGFPQLLVALASYTIANIAFVVALMMIR